MDSLKAYLEKVMGDMNATWPKYADLRPEGNTHPIPFFGDIRNAQVLTVGVNPSAGEFDKKRTWPDTMTANELNNHLQSYFMLGNKEPHKWFEPWTQALEPLGVSYKDGSAHLAAHLDLSPRTTVSMRSANPHTFLAMIKEDARWFFELLPECEAAQLMFIAGSVTKRYYMDEFIECVAYRYGFKLEEPPTLRGKGVGFNRLRGPGVDLPVFFSSLSPSAGKRRHELIQRVKENQEKLHGYINV